MNYKSRTACPISWLQRIFSFDDPSPTWSFSSLQWYIYHCCHWVLAADHLPFPLCLSQYNRLFQRAQSICYHTAAKILVYDTLNIFPNDDLFFPRVIMRSSTSARHNWSLSMQRIFQGMLENSLLTVFSITFLPRTLEVRGEGCGETVLRLVFEFTSTSGNSPCCGEFLTNTLLINLWALSRSLPI